MSDTAVNENETLDPDRITLAKSNKNDKSTNTTIDVDSDDDGRHTFVENPSTNNGKKAHVEDEQYSDSSLLWRDLYPQTFYCCITLFMAIQPGMNLAYSNNLLYHMPTLTNGQFSWITSILALFTPIGALLIGVITDQIGRKKACLLTCVPLMASWILAALTSSGDIYLFLLSRTLAGIGAGMTSVGLVYVSEISHSSYKQLFLTLNSVFFSGGVLLSTSTLRLQWNVINFTFILLIAANMALILLFVPESPIWLLRFKDSGHIAKAKTAVKRIYPHNQRVFKAEWKRLKNTSACSGAPTNNHRPPFLESVRSNPAAYKPFCIMAGLMFLQQASGAYPIISYALFVYKSIVPDTSLVAVSEVQMIAALGAIRFAGALLVCPLSRYVGRKPLLTVSCVGMALSTTLILFVGRSAPETPRPAVLLSLCGVLLYVFSSSLGVLVFPWTLVCELLPTPIRSVGGCILVSYAYLLMFVFLKVFPFMWAVLGDTNVFAVFGTVSLTMAVYVQLILPETLGKTFQEIEDYFSAGSTSEKKIPVVDTVRSNGEA